MYFQVNLPALGELHVGWDESASLAGNLASQGLWPSLGQLSLPNQRLGLRSMVPLIRQVLKDSQVSQ